MTRRKYRTRHIGTLPLVVLDFPLAVKEVLYYAAAVVPSLDISHGRPFQILSVVRVR